MLAVSPFFSEYMFVLLFLMINLNLELKNLRN